jgi:hypothetical protein
MSITLGTLALLSLLATAVGTGATIADNSIRTDKQGLNDRELNDILKDIEDGGTYNGRDYNALRDALSNNAMWNSWSDAEKRSFLKQYEVQGYLDRHKSLDNESLLADILAANGISESAPIESDFYDIDSILADSQAAIDAENERLLASLNEDLQRTGDAYTQTRNNILTQQHQRNSQIMDTLASDMERSRRNAIEAGASAGIRIAGNVNSILSAQNKMSQQSLETSNQLAQMLLNQRNAEAGLRSQWRDIEQSTYDRVRNRANSELSWGQARYDEASRRWSQQVDSAFSETSPAADVVKKYKTNAAYRAPSGSAY